MSSVSAGSNDKEMSQIPELLEGTLRDIGIPPRPAILERISNEMNKDNPDLRQLGAIIGSDVGLAAGLIAIANSPYFSYRGHVRSVNEALMLLGLRTASQAIAGLILKKIFPATPSLVRFWDASASIARLSGWLAQHYGARARIRSDDAYTYGLFRDCGIAVLMRRFKEYPETLKQANDEQERSFTEVEEQTYPTNHAMVGCLLAQSWWLPEETCLAIRHHHEYLALQENRAGLPPISLGLIAITQLAEHLFQHHTGMSKTQEWAKASAFCLGFLGMDEVELAVLYQESMTIVTDA